MAGKALLEIKDLSVSFSTDSGLVEVVDKVSLSIEPGKTLALVGESGCGKTVTASSIIRILPQPYGQITGGQVLFDGVDLVRVPVDEMYKLRGGVISMVFQEPMTALNPVHKAGAQIEEVITLHREAMKGDERRGIILDLLRKVEMPSPETRLGAYPFQLSGGMRQRVMIAMALAGNPKLLIADEPTTALDVTVQAQILDLIKSLQRDIGMAVLYITHDMGVVAEISDDVAVMYAGQIVEKGSVTEIFKQPIHPYTRGLISSMPSMDSKPKSELPSIKGVVPSPTRYPDTCRFAGRCPFAQERCSRTAPVLEEAAPGHLVRCLRRGEI
ncbi:MAG: ABC transporter ATP-binding protein [Spirochaetia bacterium]|nr:ABC transporter ATP-binding protein [Spirochaetia bacterium]